MKLSDHTPVSQRSLVRCLSVLVMLMLTGGCNTELYDVYSPQEWRDIFERAGGWTPLPFPDSKYRPGSIIQVADDGIRWIDHLESCRYPPELLAPEVGSIPSITFSKQKEFGANVMLNYAGITAGPSFSRVDKVSLNVSEHSADSLMVLKLKVWMEEPSNREQVSTVCMDELEKQNRYLVTESFRVSKGTYTLYEKTGTAIKLSAPALGQLLKLESDVKYDVTTDGKLVIEDPAIFAVRRAIRLSGDFQILGDEPDGPTSADATIEKLYFEAERQ